MADSYILTRLNAIESEVAEVRQLIERKERPPKRRKSLFGVLGRVKLTETEIDAVVGSMFRAADGRR